MRACGYDDPFCYYPIGTDDDDGGRGRPQLAKELAYFERAKQRLRNKDAYNDFLKCLSMYTQEIISRQELLQLLNDIIGRFPDLMVGGMVARCRSRHGLQSVHGFMGPSAPFHQFGWQLLESDGLRTMRAVAVRVPRVRGQVRFDGD